MEWQVMEKMRGKEDLMEATKGNAKAATKKDGFGKNEKGGSIEDQNSTHKTDQEEPENHVRKNEGIPNAVALSNHRFDPFPFFQNRNSQHCHLSPCFRFVLTLWWTVFLSLFAAALVSRFYNV